MLNSGIAKVHKDPTIRALETPSEAAAGTRSTGFSTQTTSPTIWCFVCSETTHLTPECKGFEGLSDKDRAERTLESGYCFNCLVGKHSARKCEKLAKCVVDGCGKRHHTLLHGAPRVSSPRRAASAGAVKGSHSRWHQYPRQSHRFCSQLCQYA